MLLTFRKWGGWIDHKAGRVETALMDSASQSTFAPRKNDAK